MVIDLIDCQESIGSLRFLVWSLVFKDSGFRYLLPSILFLLSKICYLSFCGQIWGNLNSSSYVFEKVTWHVYQGAVIQGHLSFAQLWLSSSSFLFFFAEFDPDVVYCLTKVAQELTLEGHVLIGIQNFQWSQNNSFPPNSTKSISRLLRRVLLRVPICSTVYYYSLKRLTEIQEH